MKITRTLIAIAAILPLTLFAQAPTETAAAGAQAAPAASPGAQRLPRVYFEGANLSEIITYLQVKSKEAGHDPNVDPLNVVISPGLETQRLPSLSLRNVSPTEVLTIATTVLGLSLEPVTGDSGAPVAWLIKDPGGHSGGADPFGSSPPSGVPSGAGIGDAGGGFPASGAVPGTGTPQTAAGPGTGGVPYTVELAASPPSTGIGGGAGMAAPRAMSRVFGVASLIASDNADPKLSEKGRAEKLDRLIRSLEKMIADQGGKAQINAYGEMDILVVKSADPDALALIAEAIEAMKLNAKSDNSAQSREESLRSELNALRGQLSIIQTEKDAQRQTLLDQIQLLKAAHRGEDAERSKR